MDQQAKKHLQDEFDATLEEKDQMITVLQTQVRADSWIGFFLCVCVCDGNCCLLIPNVMYSVWPE